MKPDLKNMSRKELEKLRSDIDKAIAKVSTKEKKEAREAMNKAAASFGYTPEEILGVGGSAKVTTRAAKKPGKPVKPGKPKYRNPDNAQETWTGKGRPPKWFIDATSGGATRESLEIKS